MQKIKQSWSKEEYEKLTQIMISLPEFEEDSQERKWEVVSSEMFKSGFKRSSIECKQKLVKQMVQKKRR